MALVYSSQQLLVFCLHAKQKHSNLFENWNPRDVAVPEHEVLLSAGKECVSGYLYDHTRDALVSKAQLLTNGLQVDQSTTKAEVSIVAKTLCLLKDSAVVL
jgi:hypothetical protein